MCMLGLLALEAAAADAAKAAATEDADDCRVAGGHPCNSERCAAPSEMDPLLQAQWPPHPWGPGTLDAYAFPKDTVVGQYVRGRREDLDRVLKRIGDQSAGVFGRLRRDGLSWNELGLDFSRLAYVRHPDNVSKIFDDEDVMFISKLLLEAPYAPDVDSFDKDALWAQTMFAHDQPLKRQACAISSSATGVKRHLRRFLANGWVEISDISKLGVDVKQLIGEAMTGLQTQGFLSRYGCYTSNAYLPALEPMLHNEKFAQLIRGYLGKRARFDGYFTFHLPDGITTSNYTAGHWHHDRCGRRIRMAVLLHDVEDDGRPTLIATGSHNLAYYSHIGTIEMSRYADSFVRSRYHVKRLTGKAGTAFLLDTNALHKGELVGNSTRTVIFLEFHARGKLPALLKDDRGKNMPCPSLKTNGTAQLLYDWKLGKPGYPLFPQDRPFEKGRRRRKAAGAARAEL